MNHTMNYTLLVAMQLLSYAEYKFVLPQLVFLPQQNKKGQGSLWTTQHLHEYCV